MSRFFFFFLFLGSITLSECGSCLWSRCARSRAPPPQRSWQRSQAQSTSAGGETKKNEEKRRRWRVVVVAGVIRDVYRRVSSVEGKRQDGKDSGGSWKGK